MHKMVEIARLEIQNDLVKYAILFFIFVGQGMFSAMTVLLLPVLLESNGIPPGIFPEPTAEMALIEALENTTLLGFIVVALVTMQVFATEIESGTVFYSLVRPIKRYEYVIGKIAARMAAVGAIIALSITIIWVYTGFLFGGDLPDVNLLDVVIPFLLLFLFIVALTSLFSTRLSVLSSGLTAIFIGAVLLALPGILWQFGELSPFYLVNKYSDIVFGGLSVLEEPLAIIIALGWIMSLTAGAVISFQKRDL
ncbi:MAG: ABC transporter permease subunit [Candidatus Odinarchaeota archaeon]